MFRTGFLSIIRSTV